MPLCAVLAANGFDDTLVHEQAEPDGNFSTVRSPNPEDPAALALGIEAAKRLGADLVLGTDPDCDRVGVAARQGDKLALLTGNQIGALLVDYLLLRRAERLDAKDTIVKTIVTSELGAHIARAHGLRTVDTLTGFKYIGELACRYETSGEYRFLMGYEESYGYLIGSHARDKDAVVSSLLICEMAAYYKDQGRTLWDVLQSLYTEYEYYLDALDSFTLKGKDGGERIQALMQAFRRDGVLLPDDPQTQVIDYSKGVDGLPAEDVVKFTYSSGSWIAVRPSGTEPKLKIYYSIHSAGQESATAALEKARKVVCKTVGE
jgi:phosphoglucomutase